MNAQWFWVWGFVFIFCSYLKTEQNPAEILDLTAENKTPTLDYVYRAPANLTALGWEDPDFISFSPALESPTAINIDASKTDLEEMLQLSRGKKAP